jgi:hypothetical protein
MPDILPRRPVDRVFFGADGASRGVACP